jgi:REP element-mobilizing transposase RayT
MTRQLRGLPDDRLATWGRGRTVRLADHDYAADCPVHVTICALGGRPFANAAVAALVCASVEQAATKLAFRLYAYCLMPDHLHVLLSPGDSRRPIADFLHSMKSYTTCEYRRMCGVARLWQTTAYDHVLRDDERVPSVAAYIANNPVRAELVTCWQEWPYTRVLVEC